MLRSKPLEVQKIVLSRGGLAGTRNPTAVLVSRIRNAEEGLRPVLDTERAPEEIERFLIIERVEPHAAARLRRAAKLVQQAVVSRGSLAGTRDPTAVLMTRIRDAEKEHAPAADAAGAATAGATQEAADVFGSDPQAYALAYYAQMQAAYPQAVQSFAGYGSYPTMQLASYPGTPGADGQPQAFQLPPGYQLYPVGVANPDGTIGALPESMTNGAAATAATASADAAKALCDVAPAAGAAPAAAAAPAAMTMAWPPQPAPDAMAAYMQAMSMGYGSYPSASYPSMVPTGMPATMGMPGAPPPPMGYPPQAGAVPGAPPMGYATMGQAPMGYPPPPGYPGMPGMPQAMSQTAMPGMAALQAMQMPPGGPCFYGSPMGPPPGPPPSPFGQGAPQMAVPGQS